MLEMQKDCELLFDQANIMKLLTKKCNVRRSRCLSILRICKWLYKLVRVLLMVREMKWESRYKGLVVLFNLLISLLMIHSDHELFTPRYANMKEKTLFKYCCPLSNKIVSRMSYRMIQLLKIKLATWVDVIFVVGISFVSLVYLLVIISTNKLPELVHGCYPRILTATRSEGAVCGNSSSLRWRRILFPW